MTLRLRRKAALERAGVTVVELFDGVRFELPWRKCLRASATAPPVIVGLAEPPVASAPKVPRPAQTHVEMVKLPKRFAIDAPPAALIRGRHNPVKFVVLWLMLCTLIFSAVFLKVGAGVPAPLRPMGLSFVAVGGAMLLFSVPPGRRRVTIAANKRSNDVCRIGPSVTKEGYYSRANHAASGCGPSGIKASRRFVPELSLHFVNGRNGGCLSQLSEEQLRWLAQERRQRLAASGPVLGGSFR